MAALLGVLDEGVPLGAALRCWAVARGIPERFGGGVAVAALDAAAAAACAGAGAGAAGGVLLLEAFGLEAGAGAGAEKLQRTSTCNSCESKDMRTVSIQE